MRAARSGSRWPICLHPCVGADQSGLPRFAPPSGPTIGRKPGSRQPGVLTVVCELIRTISHFSHPLHQVPVVATHPPPARRNDSRLRRRARRRGVKRRTRGAHGGDAAEVAATIAAAAAAAVALHNRRGWAAVPAAGDPRPPRPPSAGSWRVGCGGGGARWGPSSAARGDPAGDELGGGAREVPSAITTTG